MKLLTVTLITLAIFYSTVSMAANSVVVVVNADADVDQMTRSQVIDLFMGKYVAFPNGTKATPVEIKQETELKQQFYKELVGMSMARVNAYWARLKFTGKTRVTVPKESEIDLIEFIEQSDAAIGYIPKDKLTPKLKVVFELNE